MLYFVKKKHNLFNSLYYFFELGGSGLGKSTLVNTIFKSKVSRKSCVEEDHGIPKTVSIQSISHGSLILSTLC